MSSNKVNNQQCKW